MDIWLPQGMGVGEHTYRKTERGKGEREREGWEQRGGERGVGEGERVKEEEGREENAENGEEGINDGQSDQQKVPTGWRGD